MSDEGSWPTPRSTAQFIAENAGDVKICADLIPSAAEKILDELISNEFCLSDWKKNEVNPKTADLAAIDWIFLVDALNFCFWTDEADPTFSVTYKGTAHTGTFALCASVQRALEEGIPLTKAEYFHNITRGALQRILRSDNGTEIPLLDQRMRILQECGDVLLKKFGGSFVNCLRDCDNSAQALLKLVVENFPAFRDEGTYLDRKVVFYKRAQILVADIWACFEGSDLGLFHDIDSITMFADYRVPQVLAHFGVLKYSEELSSKLKNGELLQNGSRKEMEIRGCSIWAVELMVEEMRKMATRCARKQPPIINSIVVDFCLWGYRRKHAAFLEEVPFHRVRCIYY